MLDALGEELHETRREFAARRGMGLTATYNALHDAAVADLELKQLRTLHERLDRGVLDAYGWSDVAVPAYCAANDASYERNDFEDAVAARLSALNADRAQRIGTAATQRSLEVRKANVKKPRPRKPRSA